MKNFFDPGGHDMRNLVVVLVVLWVIYVALTFLAPAAQTTTKYGLTVVQINLLRFTIILPLLFIWITLLFSIVRFRRYHSLIKDAPEGEGFRKFVIGLWLLLMVIVVPSLIGSVTNFWPSSATLLEVSTIIRNYLTIIFYLVAFWYFWQGSRDIYHTVNPGVPSNSLRYPLVATVLALGAAFTIAVLHNPFRTTSSDALIRPTYYLPDALIILTIIIPYVLTWLFASLTILNLLSYTDKVKGIIYKQTFSSVAYGLTITIALLVGLQFLTQANSALNHAALKVILIMIYLLLLAIAVGYLLIARGARKLTAIEEVK